MFDEEQATKARAFARQNRDIHSKHAPLLAAAGGAPAEKMIKGHLFLLKHTCNSKSAANKEALKYHKRGFHTRVIETAPGVFSVYRRDLPTPVVRHGRKFIPPPPPA